MEVDLAVLADAANTTENGKLNILGVFDNLNLGPEFPAKSQTFAIVVRVVGHPSEAGQHELLLRLADADGKEIAKVGARFEAKKKKATAKPYRVPIILGAEVKFPRPGDYTFDILIDGRWERAMPLQVSKRSS